MDCQYCGQRKRLLHRCDPRRVMAHAVRNVKQDGPASALVTLEQQLTGADASAPEVYGEYYTARSSAIYSAINKRANAVVRPEPVIKRGQGDEAERVPDNHPYQELMSRINPFWSRGDLWRGTEIYLNLWGSAFWLLEKTSESSTPQSIWLLRPDRIKVLADPDTYIRGFEYTKDRVRRFYRPDEIVWFRFINPLSEFGGLSPVAVVRLVADMAFDATRYNRHVFKNSPQIDNVVFAAKETMTDDEIQDTIARLRDRYANPEKARTPLVTGDMEVKNLGLSMRDMEWLNSLRWSLEDVARVMEVPKILLEDLERSTYANIDAAERIFWRNIATHLQFLASEINEMLSPQFGDDVFLEFDLSDIEALQENIGEVHERARLDVAGSVLTPNEARESIGKEPIEGGDTLLVPINMVPLNAAGEPTEESRGLTEHRMDLLADLHEKRLDRHEARFADTQRSLFNAQEREVLASLRSTRSVTKQGGALMDPMDWRERFIREGRPLIIAALEDEAQQQISAFGFGVSFDVQAPNVQDWVRERGIFWADRVNQETARLVTQEVSAAIEAGETIRQTEARVGRVFDLARGFRTERIARTEMNSATNRGALESYRQSGVTERKRWIATRDARTRGHHLDAHGQEVPLDARFLVGGEMIEHPGDGSARNAINCLLPDNDVIATEVQAASTAYYAGPALEIRTERGHKLTVTPNHPVLTDRGFVPAQSIGPGDKVISDCLNQRMSTVNEDIANVPPTIEQVFSTFNMVVGPGVERLMGVTDFHGDGRSMDGNVEVVGANGKLWCACAAPGLQPLHDYRLCSGDVLAGVLFGQCSANTFIPGAFSPTNSRMGVGSKPLSFLDGGLSHPGVHAGAAVSRSNVILQELPADSTPGDVELQRQRLLGFSGKIAASNSIRKGQFAAADSNAVGLQDSAGLTFGDADSLASRLRTLPVEVAPDKVVSVSWFEFSGHVYDLQTLQQLYIGSGVVVHNCRCALVPIVDEGNRSAPTFNGHSDEALATLKDIKETLSKPRTVRKRISDERDAEGMPVEVVETHDYAE